MPRSISQYRVFIGSPGGLDNERKAFQNVLASYCVSDAEPRGVLFHPVGWEDTLVGPGRPQELINADLRDCDYAIFVLHDRWGTPTGAFSSGTEEEWSIAQELYATTKLRRIVLFFKKVAEKQLKDPGDQLKPVLAFRNRIEAERKHFFKPFEQTEEFCEELRRQLGKWLRDHEAQSGGSASPAPSDELSPSAVTIRTTRPEKSRDDFEFWIAEVARISASDRPDTRDNMGIVFCAGRALAASSTDIEWARAMGAMGAAKFYLRDLTSSFESFSAIADRFASSHGRDEQIWLARALINKGVTLNRLGRSEDAVSTYESVIARFGTMPERRGQVAKALYNKGVSLDTLGRSEDAIAVYDDMIARFGTATKLPLRELVARALYNKGASLGAIGRFEDEIAAYDDVIARFSTDTDLRLREQVGKALCSKGIRLGALDRNENAIAAYDDVIARFGTATELPLREIACRALFNKGNRLSALDRIEDSIATYDEVVTRFGTATELPLRQNLAGALVNKGNRLRVLGRNRDAIAIYDDLVARFGTATELPLRERVASAIHNKGQALHKLRRRAAAIKAYDELINLFGTASETKLQAIVRGTRKLRTILKEGAKPRRANRKRKKRH